jgi:hypothetical protein
VRWAVVAAAAATARGAAGATRRNIMANGKA